MDNDKVYYESKRSQRAFEAYKEEVAKFEIIYKPDPFSENDADVIKNICRIQNIDSHECAGFLGILRFAVKNITQPQCGTLYSEKESITERKDTIRKLTNLFLRVGKLQDFQLKLFGEYPRKENKPKALKAWNALLKSADAVAVEVITAHIEARLKAGAWLLSEKQFIPHPTTFLNGRGWNDDIIARTPDGKSKTVEVCTERLDDQPGYGRVYMLNKPTPSGGHMSTTVSVEDFNRKVASGKPRNILAI